MWNSESGIAKSRFLWAALLLHSTHLIYKCCIVILHPVYCVILNGVVPSNINQDFILWPIIKLRQPKKRCRIFQRQFNSGSKQAPKINISIYQMSNQTNKEPLSDETYISAEFEYHGEQPKYSQQFRLSQLDTKWILYDTTFSFLNTPMEVSF